jgi:hypothetical protein
MEDCFVTLSVSTSDITFLFVEIFKYDTVLLGTVQGKVMYRQHTNSGLFFWNVVV